jgi:hypothetical protein
LTGEYYNNYYFGCGDGRVEARELAAPFTPRRQCISLLVTAAPELARYASMPLPTMWSCEIGLVHRCRGFWNGGLRPSEVQRVGIHSRATRAGPDKPQATSHSYSSVGGDGTGRPFSAGRVCMLAPASPPLGLRLDGSSADGLTAAPPHLLPHHVCCPVPETVPPCRWAFFPFRLSSYSGQPSSDLRLPEVEK